MKTILVAVLFVGIAVARPQGGQQQQQHQADPNAVQILRYESDNSGADGYRFAWVSFLYLQNYLTETFANYFCNFSFETSDGTARQEQADLKEVEGAENKALQVKGSYSWVSPEGETYTVNFTADENGYHPEAAHIPKGGAQPAVSDA